MIVSLRTDNGISGFDAVDTLGRFALRALADRAKSNWNAFRLSRCLFGDDVTALVLDELAGLGYPNGLRIKDELEEYYDQEIQHGRLYPNLDTLVDKGLVEKGQRDGRTNSYTLTDRGR